MADLFSQFKDTTLKTPTYQSGAPAYKAPTYTAPTAPTSTPTDTSSFTPAQLQAYNYAASLAPKPSTSINSNNLAQQTPIVVPPAPTQDYSSGVNNGNALVGANNLTLTPAPVDTSTNDYLAQLKALMPAPPSETNQYNTDYASSGIDTAQGAYNVDKAAVTAAQGKLAGISAKLAGINAEAQAASLQQENRAAPGFFVGAAQAQTERQRAIRALPLQAEALAAQAEVAAAQGNAELSQSILQQATEHLDKVFQLHVTDAQNQYKYKVDLIDQALQYADKQQATKLADQKATLSSNFQQYNNFINDVRQLASTATSNLQGSLATKISNLINSLNPQSKDFATQFNTVNAQLAALQGQIQAPAKATSTSSGGTSNTGSTANLKSDVQNAVSQLQQIVKAKNFLGVDPTDYQTMADYLQQHYGTSGVAALKTAMNALGLKIDTGLDSSGNPIQY